jgi:hypothetical protein
LIGFFAHQYFLEKINLKKVAISGIVSSLIFFIVTNFGFWTTGLFYTKDIVGLMQCYVAGLPFYPANLIGDLLYTTLMFGSYYFIAGRSLTKQSV